MKLEHTDIIDAPRDQVYRIVRDELPKVAFFLPNISKIQTLEYQQVSGGETRIVNHWFAKAKMPSLVDKFINQELFSWKDKAVWNNDQHCVDYELESFLAKEIYHATGKNFFEESGADKTQLKLTCTIEIHADKIPGIPKLVAKKVVPTLEKMLEKMLGPNLTSLGVGLKAYLEESH